MRILTDKDLRALDIPLAAEAVRNFVKRSRSGETVSPARTNIPLEADTLTVTAGADPDDFGLRVYSHRPGLRRDREDQIVACRDRKTHRLKALAIGERLGAWRTGFWEASPTRCWRVKRLKHAVSSAPDCRPAHRPGPSRHWQNPNASWFSRETSGTDPTLPNDYRTTPGLPRSRLTAWKAWFGRRMRWSSRPMPAGRYSTRPGWNGVGTSRQSASRPGIVMRSRPRWRTGPIASSATVRNRSRNRGQITFWPMLSLLTELVALARRLTLISAAGRMGARSVFLPVWSGPKSRCLPRSVTTWSGLEAPPSIASGLKRPRLRQGPNWPRCPPPAICRLSFKRADPGAGGGIRTPDLRFTRALLYQLSYTGAAP